MDNDFLKKMLHDQAEPMASAVSRKIAYLESDDVFTEYETYSPIKGSNENSSIENAFSSVMTTHDASSQQSLESVADDARSKHKLLADKIAALRGISVPDYMHRK